MKQILNNSLFKVTSLVALVFGLVLIHGCEKFPLPETGSQADLTPPKAAFSTASSATDYQTIVFANESVSSTTYSWDFGDGNTSTDANPSNTFADGTYSVTLTAMDNTGASNTVTKEVVVEPGPYQPFILEPGFEGVDGDARDPWRVSWATIMGITGSPVTFGNAGAKLEVSSARAGYQEIIVEANSVYDLSFWYTMKNDRPDPWAIVSIVAVTENAPIDSKQKALDATIASITVNNTEEPSVYVQEELTFNSGDNTTVGIYFYNDANVETRLDEFAIEIGTPGAVPPSAGFNLEQSAADYLEYSFTDGSTDAVSWEWDFGDGNTSMDQNPTHTYATHNVYDVTLTVKNAAGLEGSLTKSIDIQAPVSSAFTATVNPADYQSYSFTDESEGAVMLLWEFGDGFQFTGMNPSHTYTEDGTYTVKLTAYSVTGAMDVSSETLNVTQGEVVTLVNGDFEANSTGWKISSFPGGTTNPFNSSSDGAFMDYFGNATSSKTRGAKWTMSTSDAEWRSSSSRYAYQAIDLTPGNEYTFEFSYAMKGDAATDPVGGRRMIGEILTGHFTDGTVARAASDAGALVQLVGTMANGKTSHEVLMADFTAPASGEVSIWLYAVTPVDGYIDNVKIYVKE